METIFDDTALTEKIRQIESEIELDSFWDNNSSAQKTFQELNQLKQKLNTIQSIKQSFENIDTGLTLLNENPNDNDILNEVNSLVNTLEKEISTIEIECLLSHEWDTFDCIFTINAGAGGTDAQDWAEMLLRMYTRWFDTKNFSMELTEITSGDEAGIKSVTIMVSGTFCYGICKNEIGIHRLVRQSPLMPMPNVKHHLQQWMSSRNLMIHLKISLSIQKIYELIPTEHQELGDNTLTKQTPP